MDIKEQFVSIIKDHQGIVYKVAKAYSFNRQDEEDLYQEIVYQLWKSYPTFRNEARVTTWMYRVALNTAVGHSKKEKQKADQSSLMQWHTLKTDTGNSLNEERMEVMYSLIKKLTKIERGLILLYLDGKITKRSQG